MFSKNYNYSDSKDYVNDIAKPSDNDLNRNYIFYQQYKKYKQKYLNLKNLMKGGHCTKDEPKYFQELIIVIIKFQQFLLK